MRIHPLFPTLVCEWVNDNNPQLKESFFNDLLNRSNNNPGYPDDPPGTNSSMPNSDLARNYGWFDERPNIHHDPILDELFTWITRCAKQYISQLQVDDDLWDFNVVKSWKMINDAGMQEEHDHSDGNLSFVYYVNIPDPATVARISFRNEHQPNDIIGNMFYARRQGPNTSESSPIVRRWNEFNSTKWTFVPGEGVLFIFPGTLKHFTDHSHLKNSQYPQYTTKTMRNSRVTIAGDFLLTYKKQNRVDTGLMPPHTWKLFA